MPHFSGIRRFGSERLRDFVQVTQPERGKAPYNLWTPPNPSSCGLSTAYQASAISLGLQGSILATRQNYQCSQYGASPYDMESSWHSCFRQDTVGCQPQNLTIVVDTHTIILSLSHTLTHTHTHTHTGGVTVFIHLYNLKVQQRKYLQVAMDPGAPTMLYQLFSFMLTASFSDVPQILAKTVMAAPSS